MSTTFEVFPHCAQVPTFRELVVQVTPRIEDYLARHRIRNCPRLSFDVRDNDNNSQGYTQDSPMQWSEDHYGWFYFDGLPGGTDAYWRRINELMIECWAHEKTERQRSRQMAHYIDECLAVGHRWYFRRSAGQPALINLAYGYLAAALAELTDGFIFSDDSAWDYERFPCRAAEFYEFYFEPEKALNANFREWSERCLRWLREETSGIG